MHFFLVLALRNDAFTSFSNSHLMESVAAQNFTAVAAMHIHSNATSTPPSFKQEEAAKKKHTVATLY